MTTDLVQLELSDCQFADIRDIVYRVCGINMHEGKEGLVKGRLMKRLRVLDLNSFGEYLRFVRADKSRDELTAMIDALTTNKTSFFREAQHFDFLKDSILPDLRARGGPIRIWSAGCSSGEEAYTLAILLREGIPEIDRLDARILATDISTRVLATARAGLYESEKLDGVPAPALKRYFEAEDGGRSYRAGAALKRLLSLARLNLMEEWPMRGPFDAIFCRNVMIYFDKPTQERLVHRFWELLGRGGHLFVGHSESIGAWAHELTYVRPAVYVKP